MEHLCSLKPMGVRIGLPSFLPRGAANIHFSTPFSDFELHVASESHSLRNHSFPFHKLDYLNLKTSKHLGNIVRISGPWQLLSKPEPRT